jgi:hypothetical protein
LKDRPQDIAGRDSRHHQQAPTPGAARRWGADDQEALQGVARGSGVALQQGLGNTRVSALGEEASGDIGLYLQDILGIERSLGVDASGYLPWRAQPSWLQAVRPLYRVAWAERGALQHQSTRTGSESAPVAVRQPGEGRWLEDEEELLELLPEPERPLPRAGGASPRRAFLSGERGVQVDRERGADPWGLLEVWQGGVTEQALLECLREHLPEVPPAPPLSLVHEGIASLLPPDPSGRSGAARPSDLRAALLESGPPEQQSLVELQTRFAPYPDFAEAAGLQIEALMTLDVGRVEASAEPTAVMRDALPGEARWDPAEVLSHLRQSRGTPLSEDLAVRLGATLGFDVHHVQIHTDAAAADAAAALSARAFAAGAHVYFAQGAWAPGTPEGDRLLLHELTHVGQHDRGELPTSNGLTVSDPADASEQEARAAEALPLAPAPEIAEQAAAEPQRAAFAASTMAWSLLRTADEDAEAPVWARRALSSVQSFYSYHLIEGLLTAWVNVGVNDQDVTAALDATIVNFDASLADLRHGAEIAGHGGDAGFSLDDEIEMLQGMLQQLKVIAVGADPSDTDLSAEFETAAGFLVQWDPAYSAAETNPPAAGEAEGGLLETLLTVIGHTLAGDFIEDPHIVAIIIRALLGLIPYVDQALDIEDILGSLYLLVWEGKVDDVWIWVGLVLTIIGCIPEAGSVIKGVGKSGVKMVRVVATEGAKALKLDKLLGLIADGAKRLDLDKQLKVALDQWDDLARRWSEADLAGPVAEYIRGLLTRLEQRALEAKELIRDVPGAAALSAKLDDVLRHSRAAKEAVGTMVSSAVERGKKAIQDITRFVKEEIGLRRLKGGMSEEAFEALVSELGEDLVRKLAADLDEAMISLLAQRLGREGLEALDPVKVGRALKGLEEAPFNAFKALSPEQMTEFLKRDPLIHQAFQRMSPEEQVELLEQIKKYDKTYDVPGGGSRAGHIVNEHGPHLPDEYLFARAQKMGRDVSKWGSEQAMEAAIKEASAKVLDPVYAVSVKGDPQLDVFKKKFWDEVDVTDLDIIKDALADPKSYGEAYFKGGLTGKFNPIYKGSTPGAGKMYSTDGTTITNTDNFKIVFQWDASGVLQVLTGHPVP